MSNSLSTIARLAATGHARFIDLCRAHFVIFYCHGCGSIGQAPDAESWSNYVQAFKSEELGCCEDGDITIF